MIYLIIWLALGASGWLFMVAYRLWNNDFWGYKPAAYVRGYLFALLIGPFTFAILGFVLILPLLLNRRSEDE